MRYVALLRAINTPPRHVKMARLREVFESMGFENVETVIASGNVLFDAHPRKGLVADIEANLEAQLGFSVPTFLLGGAELEDILSRQPFSPEDGPVEISVLPTAPDTDAAARVEAGASGPDAIAIRGRAVYWQRTGTTQESRHSETRVMRMLGMSTTRRALATLKRIADRL